MSEETGVAPPLDLSLLAKVAGPTPEPDSPPRLPPDEPITQTKTTPRRGIRGTRGSRATPPPTTDKPESRKVVRDETTIEYRPGILVKPLRDLYTSVGTLVLPFNQPVGTAFIQNAEACARSLDDAARQDPRIRKALMALIASSVWGQVIAAHMPILLALAMTYGPARHALAPQPPEPTEGDDVVNPMSNGVTRDTRAYPRRGNRG